jgi:hypothetical protein
MSKTKLSDEQLQQLRGIAATLRTSDDREAFISTVARALARHGPVSNRDISDAIEAVLGATQTESVFLCDATSTPTKRGRPMTTINRKYRRLAWDDPAAWGEDGILKDGVAVRLPVSLADAKMSEVHDAARAVRSRQYNKPGWRAALHQDAAAKDARQAAYDSYEFALTLAWKPNADPDDDDVDNNGTAPGTVVTQAFTLPADATMDQVYSAYDQAAESAYKGKPVRDATPVHAADGRSHQQVMREVYKLRDQELSESWRNPTAE